jgi:hypothetical protein
MLEQGIFNMKQMSMSISEKSNDTNDRPYDHVNPFYRVFVNRGLMLDKVKFYGFDMDYTIAGIIFTSLII